MQRNSFYICSRVACVPLAVLAAPVAVLIGNHSAVAQPRRPHAHQMAFSRHVVPARISSQDGYKWLAPSSPEAFISSRAVNQRILIWSDEVAAKSIHEPLGH
jgi:hypothetical protein